MTVWTLVFGVALAVWLTSKDVIEPRWAIRCIVVGLPLSLLIVVGVNFLISTGKQHSEERGD